MGADQAIVSAVLAVKINLQPLYYSSPLVLSVFLDFGFLTFYLAVVRWTSHPGADAQLEDGSDTRA